MALKVSAVYYAVVNVLLFIFMGIDKRRAIKDKGSHTFDNGINRRRNRRLYRDETFSSQNEEMVFLCGIRHRRHTAYSAFVDVR